MVLRFKTSVLKINLESSSDESCYFKFQDVQLQKICILLSNTNNPNLNLKFCDLAEYLLLFDFVLLFMIYIYMASICYFVSINFLTYYHWPELRTRAALYLVSLRACAFSRSNHGTRHKRHTSQNIAFFSSSVVLNNILDLARSILISNLIL